MKLIRPTALTDAMLTSSTAPENDYPVWAAATVYAVGARVILTSTHRKYEALAASTGVNPATDPTKWLDLGPTNRWAMSFAATLANSGVTAGTYTKVTVDAKGRVTTGASLASADVTGALGYAPANKAGESFTGSISVVGTITATGDITAIPMPRSKPMLPRSRMRWVW